MIAVALGLLFLLLLLGVPVGLAFMGVTGALVLLGNYDPGFLFPYAYSRLNSVVLLAIPMFVLAGALINQSGLGNRLVDFVESGIGKVRGSLGLVMTVTSGVFGAITGSSAATMSAIGSIMLPRMNEAGYPRGYSASLMASSAVLGMLIPPSGMMILFAWIGSQNVLAAFLACFLPGVILMTLLSACNLVMARKFKAVAAHEAQLAERPKVPILTRTRKAGTALLLPFIILGGIYGGVMTPTEAAGVSVLYAAVVGFVIHRTLGLKGLFVACRSAAVTTGVIAIMMFGIVMMNRIYIMEGIPGQIMGAMLAISDDPLIMLLMLNAVILVIGMLMDDVSGILLCTPLLMPLAIQVGVDPIHFAAILGVNLGMGNITPPVAPLVYWGAQMNDVPVVEMLKPTLILIVFAWIPTLLITTYIPGVALWLPNLLLGY
jgi:tripartite ATP-independent transporter DctM subunit